jgi:hypothetical protein
MNRLLPALAVVGLALLLVVPVAVAQELTADDYIEFWKPHEGTWKTTTEFNGKTESGTFIFRRAQNQKCFLLYLEGTGGASVQQLQGFDPVTRKNVVWGFTGDGDCWFHTIGIDGMKKGTKLATGAGGTWVTRTSSRDGKTTTETGKWKFTQVDEKQLTIVWSDRKEDGKPVADLKMTMDRQPDQGRRSQPRPAAAKADSQDLTTDDYVEFWRPLLGSWKTVIEVAGKRIEGTSRYRLAPHNKCLLSHGESEGQPSFQAIDGYDPGSKKWTSVTFDADGSFSILTLEFADMKKGKRLGKGIIGKVEEKRSAADSKTSTTTGVLSCTEFAENQMVVTGTDGKQDGQPSPDLKLSLERQPDGDRRPRQ